MVIHFQNWFSNIYVSESEKGQSSYTLHHTHTQYTVHTDDEKETSIQDEKEIKTQAKVLMFALIFFLSTYYHMYYMFFLVLVSFLFWLFCIQASEATNAHTNIQKIWPKKLFS